MQEQSPLLRVHQIFSALIVHCCLQSVVAWGAKSDYFSSRAPLSCPGRVLTGPWWRRRVGMIYLAFKCLDSSAQLSSALLIFTTDRYIAW